MLEHVDRLSRLICNGLLLLGTRLVEKTGARAQLAAAVRADTLMRQLLSPAFRYVTCGTLLMHLFVAVLDGVLGAILGELSQEGLQ